MMTTGEVSYRTVELVESVANELASFIDDLQLDPGAESKEVQAIVSTLLADQLHVNRQLWLDIFKRHLRPS